MNDVTHKALYDMTASVIIKPVGMIGNMEHVELRINDQFIGEYPTYTAACDEFMRALNDSF
jgi:hypothetical protein